MSSGTIYALSSAPGKAGVSVVRVSGPAAFASLRRLAPKIKEIEARKAIFLAVTDPRTQDLIDRALVIAFRGPSSFTGEDVVEYHLHGSTAVLDALLSALSSCEGHRLAEPGEYTRRAFENGKLDLTEAEAVADLINAETQAQRQQALAQMDGALSSLYEGWRERLVRVMAYIEAVIDFPDEDIPDSQVMTMLPELQALKSDIDHHLNDNRRGERLRDGIQVAILGAPNAGKSSLMNILARRDIAIVSAMAGTTRDVVEAHFDIAGYPVLLADTAGLRDIASDATGHDGIESEGIRRALARADQADLRLLVFDGTTTPDEATMALAGEKSILVFNKSDAEEFKPLAYPDSVSLSTATGENLEALLDVLSERIKELYGFAQERPSLTRARHRAALEECNGCIVQAMAAEQPELMAEDVRMAARAMGRITGRVDVEDLLDVIFRDFCIGK
jgi:tRNA modification GTPase